MAETYNKPATAIEQQIRLLVDRGLIISDQEAASHYLTHIGYYRLRGYWIPFEQPKGENGEHTFKKGTHFEQIIKLYDFDRALRLLVMDAIERIEISVRNQWVQILAEKHGAHAYLDSTLFSGSRQFGRSLAEIAGAFERSKEPYILTYKRHYKEPDLPPVWASVGIMTLGQFSRWFANLKPKALKRDMAAIYGYDEGALSSFLHHLTVIRNLCAHHSRLWNRDISLAMKLPRSKPVALIPNLEYGPDPNQAPRKLYNTLVVLAYFMDIISPDNHWKRHLKNIAKKHDINLSNMGFPANFEQRPLWQEPLEWERQETPPTPL